MINEEKNDYLDDYFRDKLFDYESPAPEDTWTKIDSQMKRKKLIILWTVSGSLAASILILISIGVGYYFGSRHSLSSESNNSGITAKTLEKSKQTKENEHNVTSERNYNTYPVSNQTNTINRNENKIVNNKQLAYNGNELSENSKTEMISANSIPGLKSSKQITSLNKIEPRQANLINKIQKNRPFVSNKKIDLLPVNDEIQASSSINAESKKKWALGGNAGPFYSAWKVNNANGVYRDDYVTSVEKPNVAYTGGLNVNMETRRWRFESGVYYSRSDQNLNDALKNLVVINNNDMIKMASTDNQNVFFTPSGITNDAFIGRIWKVEKSPNTISVTGDSKTRSSFEYYSVYYGSKNTSYTIVSSDNNVSKKYLDTAESMVQQNKYIEVPFIAGYKIIDRKIDVFISSGICTNILLSSKAYINLNNDIISIGPTQTIRTFNYSGIFGLAFEVPLAKKISFRFEPRLSYSISSIDKNSNIKVHPYAFGAFSGVSIHF